MKSSSPWLPIQFQNDALRFGGGDAVDELREYLAAGKATNLVFGLAIYQYDRKFFVEG